MNILHLTTILPAPLSTKARENDILIRLAQEYEKKYPDSRHHFIFITPHSNWLFALLKKKWREYLDIINKGSFQSAGFEVTVVGMPGFAGDINFRKPLAWIGYRFFSKRIRSAIRKINPDIVHAHNMHSSIELAELIKREYGIKYLVTARSIEQQVLNRISKNLLNPFAIISHNLVSANRCKDLNIPVMNIPHPVDEIFFDNEIKNSLCNNYQLKIVTVCGLVKLKNIDRVVKALHGISSGFSFTIYGDGPEKSSLQALAESLNVGDIVFFKGFQPHKAIARQLTDYDLFIMPSFPETLGRVYFEALASGVPVIASKNTGIDGMIEHKVHGYLVDHNSVDNIKDAILQFMALSPEQKLQMKRNAMTFAKQFTWDVVLEKYYIVYNVRNRT